MASGNLLAQTQQTDPLGRDLAYIVRDPNGVPADRKLYLGDMNVSNQGFMVNGKISVSAAAGTLTVSILTLNGGTPSATDPISVWVNGTYRRITASTTLSLAGGTNWFNSGSAELATKEVDYFVYLIDVGGTISIGCARIPTGRVFSDFSATTTNEKYLGKSSAPAATDNVILIGRFAATLSAGAGYTWTVPTFTNANLIQRPVYFTRQLSYTPTWASSGTAVALGNGTLTGTYQVRDHEVMCEVSQVNGSTTTYGTGFYTWTMPFTLATYYPMPCSALDSGTAYYTGTTYDIGANNLIHVVTSGNASPWGQTLPITWATGDTLAIRGGGRL